jgi:hypothetical protein
MPGVGGVQRIEREVGAHSVHSVGRRHDDSERYYDRLDVDSWVVDLLGRLSRGDSGAVSEALRFLEHDPYFFRSGYARERIARRLASIALSDAEKARARLIVSSTVDGRRHCPQPGAGKLAGAVADNALRRELRARLHHRDHAVVRRALRMVVNVHHPGLTRDDLAAARTLVLSDAGRGRWLSPTVARQAAYLWSREWEAELRSLLPHHGPDRAGAKRLLDAVKRRPDP